MFNRLINKITAKKQGVRKSRPVLPGYKITFGITVSFVSIFIILPFLAVFWQLKDLSVSEFIGIVFDERAVAT